MQAILTKWIPSTDTKPFRIKAWTEHLNRLCSLTLSLAEVDQACFLLQSNGQLTNKHRHQYVVEKLLLKNGWDHVGIVGSGEILKGFAFICINAYDSQSTIESSEHGITRRWKEEEEKEKMFAPTQAYQWNGQPKRAKSND